MRLQYFLSILSRFYFYKHGGLFSVRQVGTFNPIKVLFLHYFTPYLVNALMVFQSYQGSIFTNTAYHDVSGGVIFQSYQGSIFTNSNISPDRMDICFQSYQGSIFTEYNLLLPIAEYWLSILSRFYFYTNCSIQK